MNVHEFGWGACSVRPARVFVAQSHANAQNLLKTVKSAQK